MTYESPDIEHTITRAELLDARARDVHRHEAEANDAHSSMRHNTSSEARLRLHVLGSGSKGNSSVIEGPEGSILVDCGFSKKETLSRMRQIGLDPTTIKAIVVTHEHGDHISGVGVLSRGLSLPVYTSSGTARDNRFASQIPETELLHSRDVTTIAGISVSTFPTSHDAAEPIGLRFEYCKDAIGYATDTGRLSFEATEMLSECRVLAIESNHDPEMLQRGPYPYHLKQRILSDRGHLSNEQTAAAVGSLLCNRLETIVGMHLSETNNLPELSLLALKNMISQNDHPALAIVARQFKPITVE